MKEVCGFMSESGRFFRTKEAAIESDKASYRDEQLVILRNKIYKEVSKHSLWENDRMCRALHELSISSNELRPKVIDFLTKIEQLYV